MVRKGLYIFLLLMLTLAIMPPNVLAADGFLGGMEGDIWTTITNIMNLGVPAPQKALYGDAMKGTMPLWTVLLVFCVIFSVLWLASGQVPLFKADENKKPRKWFCIGLSFLVIFSTPVVDQFLKIIGAFTSLTLLALVIAGGYTLWTMLRGNIASNKTSNAQSSQELAKAAQMSAEAAVQSKQAEALEHKLAQATKTGLKQQVDAIVKTRKDLSDVLTQLQKLRGTTPYTPAHSVIRKIDDDVRKISADIGSILSFKTKNDRLMANMDAATYQEAKKESSITRSASGFAQIRKNEDTVTNDFGRIISGLVEELRQFQLRDVKSCDRMIAMCTNAINVSNRMERDIVLEEQMVQKL